MPFHNYNDKNFHLTITGKDGVRDIEVKPEEILDYVPKKFYDYCMAKWKKAEERDLRILGFVTSPHHNELMEEIQTHEKCNLKKISLRYKKKYLGRFESQKYHLHITKKKESRPRYNTRKVILQLIARKEDVLAKLMLYFDKKDGAKRPFECHRFRKQIIDNIWDGKEGKKKYARLVEYSGLLKT